MTDPGRCAMCGRPTAAHDRHLRFVLPEPVLRSPQRDATPGTWTTHADPNQSVMMQTPGVGAFVRVLLPVRLTGGHTVTFGVWLGVHPDDLQRAYEVWWEPEYTGLVLTGLLANPLPVWGLLGAPVTAVVRHPDETPYCDSSTDQRLADVLSREWPHDPVLDALGDR